MKTGLRIPNNGIGKLKELPYGKIIACLAVAAFMIMMLVKPDFYLDSARQGLSLYATSVLPSLFPFYFFSLLLTYIGSAKAVSAIFQKPVKLLYNAPKESAYVLLLSMLSGYPVGASMTAELYSAGAITSKEAKAIAAFASTSGPIFMLGTVGSAIFNDARVGIIVLCAHYLAALINGLIFRVRNKPNRILRKKQTAAKDGANVTAQSKCVTDDVVIMSRQDTDSIMSRTIANSTLSMLYIGGYVVLCGMLVDTLSLFNLDALIITALGERAGQPIVALIQGLIEMTRGSIDVRNAIAKSKNVPAVKLLNALNRDKVKTNLTDIGFLTDDDNVNLNMALGVFDSGLTIKQLAQGYMTLANDGIFQNAEFIRKIEDSQGRVLYKRENETKKVFAEDTAYLTTDVLKDVVSFGTAKSFDVDIPLAGKTGTVGKKNCPNNSDALFCSYTPKETTVFWVFSDYDDLLSEGITGSSAPVNLANSYYADIYKNNNAVDFSMPKTVTKLKIDKITLENSGKILIANNYIPKSETTEEIFSIFNMPTKVTKRNIPQQQKQQTKEENSQEFFKNFFNTLIKRQYLGA